LTFLGFAILITAASYALINVIAVLVWRFPRKSRSAPELLPVTVLKPLCGAEPRLYEDLRTFCTQAPGYGGKISDLKHEAFCANNGVELGHGDVAHPKVRGAALWAAHALLAFWHADASDRSSGS
jgi:hypothetical protein